jgi:prolyl oligopeptidase
MRTLVVAAALVPLSAVFAAQTRPVTTVREVTDVMHGTTIVDPYRWLEDQDSPETRAWIDQQTRYTRGVLDGIPQRDELRARLADFVRTPLTGWPRFEGGRYFYSRREVSEQLPSYYVREGLEGPERRLLDVRAFSSDDTRNVALFDVATDGKLVAYGVREGGADETEVRIRDVDTGQDLPDHLHTGAHYAVILLPDGQGFLYTLRTDAGTRVYEHRMGTDPASDVLVFGEGYPDTMLIWLSASEDRRYWMQRFHRARAITRRTICTWRTGHTVRRSARWSPASALRCGRHGPNTGCSCGPTGRRRSGACWRSIWPARLPTVGGR